ncbi:ubiquinol-cytochrome C chaperone family protein [Sphingomonas sp.]|uniref:ubiquinol-cytochrome C chaperone family protein n=1 Tax=Sphingomonas sp. TaxID=28214 RepID=UPI00389DCD8B
MLGFLFRGLTAQPARGEAPFGAVTDEARRRSWYVEGAVPDTLDGRFAVLATIAALVLVRLEREGEAGHAASVALTERFIEVMESEHRELGLGDPTLGKTIRKLVGMLARRTDLWRDANDEWTQATRDSLYRGDIAEAPLQYSTGALRELARRLEATPLADLEQGKIA